MSTLRPQLLEVFKLAGEKAMMEFKEWFVRLEQCEAASVDYVHGYWGVRAANRLVEDELLVGPLLTFIAAHDECEDLTSGMTMGLDEFAVQVEAMERIFGEYLQLSERHLALR